jgi:hypothetical protein
MDWISVTVQEIPPAPPNVITVTCNVIPGVCVCPGQSPQSAPQGATGSVTFTFIKLGGCMSIDFTATTTTPGTAPVTSFPRTPIVSPDINGDCLVDLIDFGIFAASYLTANPCCDYNCDGIVSLVDFGIFVSHYLHRC